jgi:hypothetical protein
MTKKRDHRAKQVAPNRPAGMTLVGRFRFWSCRLDFTPLEAEALASKLMAFIRPEAVRPRNLDGKAKPPAPPAVQRNASAAALVAERFSFCSFAAFVVAIDWARG